MINTDLPRGTVLGGKYKVEGMLGQGGMGSVYQATNASIGRKVAIKLLDPKLANNADFIHRFQMEAKAAALIGHPGIVDVLDMGETDEGMPFIVMEYLEGVTLKSLLKRSGALTAPQAVAVLVPVLDALIAAHAAGVIHRDLKPANIFVCLKPTTAVKILDFGISKFSTGTSGITQTGTSMGTPAYMSPEQVRGDKTIGPQSDLYSIGAILYNLVSGHPPFEGESDLAVVARVLTDLHRPLADVRPDLPAKLSTICDRLLTKAPDKRPANAGQVKQALEAVATPDSEAIWAAARVAFRSDTSSGLKLQQEAPTTPTTPTGGRRQKAMPRASAPVQATRAAPEGRSVMLPVVIVGLAVLGLGGGYFGWQVTRPPAPSSAIEIIPEPPAKPVAAIPAPPAAQPLLINVTGEPASVRFTVDGAAQPNNPTKVRGNPGEKKQLIGTAEGFLSQSVELDFDAARDVTMTLLPEPKKTAAATPRPREPKDKEKKKGGLSIDEQNPYK
jgi:serine/threonine-protein kinase